MASASFGVVIVSCTGPFTVASKGGVSTLLHHTPLHLTVGRRFGDRSRKAGIPSASSRPYSAPYRPAVCATASPFYRRKPVYNTLMKGVYFVTLLPVSVPTPAIPSRARSSEANG